MSAAYYVTRVELGPDGQKERVYHQSKAEKHPQVWTHPYDKRDECHVCRAAK